jgi:acyl-coenzyme A thioesterase PaaI-like protein
VTEPAPSDAFGRPDPYLEYATSSILEVDDSRAIAELGAGPELDNHAEVRHAGALFTVGYAASRALVGAALAAQGSGARASMIDSEIEYTKMVSAQRVRAVAMPGEGWEDRLARTSEGEANLPTEMTLTDEEGRTVAEMKVLWQVTFDEAASRT